MKGEKKKTPEELRMTPGDFDEMLRRALGVTPERSQPKEKSPQKAKREGRKSSTEITD